jgi:ATP-binding cassette subfamily F protein uup
MQNPNFLLLDEPTNDLDILTLNVLEEYLAGFKGCVVIASHDRYFMDKIVDHIFEYRSDGTIKDFPGNYTQLRDSMPDNESRKEGAEKEQPKKERIKISSAGDSGKTNLSYKEKKELEGLEEELAKAAAERSLIESQISEGRLSPEMLMIKAERLGELLRLIDEKEMRWLELSDR